MILIKKNEILKHKCSSICNECFKKDNIIRELQKEYDGMKYSHHRVKEEYDNLKSEVKRLEEKGFKLVLNNYIDQVAVLKQELAEKEKKNNKLQSYHASSYILERIFNITPDDNDSEKNKKGIGSEYHQVPPPLEKSYTFYDDEKVAKAISMVD
ncbi:hypothetical protein Hanom_Chr06g00531681 [Helianthus anomalus]